MTKMSKLKCCINKSNWADLPLEILELITKRLQSPILTLRFRSVCTSWRSAISPSPHPKLPPSSATATATATGGGDHSSPVLSIVTICRLECHHKNSACLVKVFEKSPGEFVLLTPLTIPNSNFKFGNSINLLDCALIELGKGYHFNSNLPDDYCVNKAVNFRGRGVLAIHGIGRLGFRVFGDEKWTFLDDNSYSCTDILVYQDEYYVIERYGKICVLDNLMNLVEYLPPILSDGQHKNLVESNGHLYVVDTFFQCLPGELALCDMMYKIVDMKVFELDEKWGTWVPVKSLEDQIFVIGRDVCFSVSANDFHGCQGNCIYFIERESVDEHFPLLFFEFDHLEEPDVVNLEFHDFEYYQGGLGDYDNREIVSQPPSQMLTCVASSSKAKQYYHDGVGHYAISVFDLEDRSIKNVEESAKFKQLFSPPESCLCST